VPERVMEPALSVLPPRPLMVFHSGSVRTCRYGTLDEAVGIVDEDFDAHDDV